MSRLKLSATPASVQQDGIRLMEEALVYNTNVRPPSSLMQQLFGLTPHHSHEMPYKSDVNQVSSFLRQRNIVTQKSR